MFDNLPIANCPAWAVMWGLAAVVFGTIKLLTWLPHAGRLRPAVAAGYLFAWPGLDAAPFLARQPDMLRPAWYDWLTGPAYLIAGVVLAGPVRALIGREHPVLMGAAGMAAVVLVLHFGLFRLLALAWRSAGYNVEPIMQSPFRATSLVEFWSCRWNRAFRDMARQLILRPLVPRLGATGATCCVFLVSGLLHDLVISVPAGAGYGRPTLYFLLQAVGVLLQRTHLARHWKLNTGLCGWLVTAAFLLVPIGCLFPPEFLERVIVPFIDALTSL
jgi:alginate O-acetyltransferase complex protein AlgI